MSSIKPITDLHKEISKLITPEEYIETKLNTNYVASHYMRYLQNKYFPTSNWTIEEKPVFNMNKLVYWVVTGKLTWDYSYIGMEHIKREGMMAAAHAVQYLNDKENKAKKTDNLSDLGNDVKSANTDTWKKALNFYLNIGDDIYQWAYPELSEDQKKTMKEICLKLPDDPTAKGIIISMENDSLLLNTGNYEKQLNRLKAKISRG